MARPSPKDRMRARMKREVPVDLEGMDPEMRQTMQGERGRVQVSKEFFAPAEKLTIPPKNPRSTPARMMGQSQEIKESYDDMIAKARGRRAYYQGSPSKTKSALISRGY